AHGGHLRHARDRLQMITEVPILETPKRGEIMRPRAIDERVLIDPADAGGIGSELGLHARRQAGQYLAEVLEHARARPAEVRAVLEDDVHVAVAEVGEAADSLDARRPEKRADDRVSDPVLADVLSSI